MRIFFFPIGTTVQREFDIVQQVCSKKLKSCDGYKENIKKGRVALMVVLSLSHADWFKVTKVITLKTQYLQC